VPAQVVLVQVKKAIRVSQSMQSEVRAMRSPGLKEVPMVW
jgi:hypothetical protein